MKIGIIAQRINPDWHQAIDIAAMLGVDGIQLYANCPAGRLIDLSAIERRAISAHCADCGLELFSLCGELGGYGLRLPEKRKENVCITKRNVDMALELGCRIVTSHIGAVRTDHDDPLRRNQISALREIGEYVNRMGAYFAIETGSEPGVILRELLLEADTPGVCVNLDPGNMVMVTGENPVKTVNALSPWIVHTHIKDGIHLQDCDTEKVYAAFATGGIKQLIAEGGELFKEVLPGTGEVPWAEYIAALRNIGYDGVLVIERERSDNALKEAKQIVKFVKNICK